MIRSSHVVKLERETDTYLACERTATLAAEVGFDRYRCADIETAVSEICTNALRHAAGGWVALRVLESRMEVVVTDRGPGFSQRRQSVSGLGIGLEGAGRLMSSLTVTPLPEGSRVTMSTELPAEAGTHAPGVWSVSTAFRAKSGQAVSGDAATAAEQADGSVRVALVDGLGSGAEAATAADRVLEGMQLADQSSPAEALMSADRAARDTRGAAAVVVFVSGTGAGMHAGVGDVSAQVTSSPDRLPSRPGIVGAGTAVPADTAFDLTADSAVLLWSDGLQLDERARRRLPSAGGELEWMEGLVLANGDPRDDAGLVLVRRKR